MSLYNEICLLHADIPPDEILLIDPYQDVLQLIIIPLILLKLSREETMKSTLIQPFQFFLIFHPDTRDSTIKAFLWYTSQWKSIRHLNGIYVWWIGWNPVNRFNHTSWVGVITPTDRPKSVRNRCVVEVLVAFLCCHVVFFFIFIFLWV